MGQHRSLYGTKWGIDASSGHRLSRPPGMNPGENPQFQVFGKDVHMKNQWASILLIFDEHIFRWMIGWFNHQLDYLDVCFSNKNICFFFYQTSNHPSIQRWCPLPSTTTIHSRCCSSGPWNTAYCGGHPCRSQARQWGGQGRTQGASPGFCWKDQVKLISFFPDEMYMYINTIFIYISMI